MLYVPRKSSFISTQFFVLNLVDWFIVLSQKFIIFWYSIIVLLYLSQIINNFLSFFWRYISFFRYFFIMFICSCFWFFFFFFCKVFEIFVILSAILLSIKHHLLLLFLELVFWDILKNICNRLFGMIKKFLAVCTPLTYIFINIFTDIFSKRQKYVAFHKYHWVSWISHCILYLRFN